MAGPLLSVNQANIGATLTGAACCSVNRTRPGGARPATESGGQGVAAVRLGLPNVPEIRGRVAKLLFRPPLRTPFILAWSAWWQCHRFGVAAAHYKAHRTQTCPKPGQASPVCERKDLFAMKGVKRSTALGPAKRQFAFSGANRRPSATAKGALPWAIFIVVILAGSPSRPRVSL
jgi:hypothetical protein